VAKLRDSPQSSAPVPKAQRQSPVAGGSEQDPAAEEAILISGWLDLMILEVFSSLQWFCDSTDWLHRV